MSLVWISIQYFESTERSCDDALWSLVKTKEHSNLVPSLFNQSLFEVFFLDQQLCVCPTPRRFAPVPPALKASACEVIPKGPHWDRPRRSSSEVPTHCVAFPLRTRPSSCALVTMALGERQ